MKSTVLASLIGAASLASASPAVEKRQNTKVPHIVVRGNAFFAGNDRFFVRGIDYQPGGSSENKDPLADTKVCLRDLEEFKKLGVNTVRVYSTDNSKDHKACMDAYAQAGIYLLLDINNPKYSINRNNPDPSYNADYLQSVFAYIDEFARYDNTMAFFSANEVVHGTANTSLAARHVKATTRDIKSYMAKRGLRQVPVGYSAADVSENRLQQAEYFNCGTDDARSDFFAFVSIKSSLPDKGQTANMCCPPDRTTTRGARPTSRSRAGTRRSRPSRTMACPSSCPSTAATTTSVTLARSRP